MSDLTSKFKPGDRVVVTNPLGCGSRDNEGVYGNYFVNDTGLVKEVCSGVVIVDFDFPDEHGDTRFRYNVDTREIELDEVCKTPLWRALE